MPKDPSLCVNKLQRNVEMYCTSIVFVISVLCSDCADLGYLKSTITDYLSEIREENVNKAFKARTRDFIYQQFQKFGLETEFNNFSANGLPPVSLMSMDCL